MRMYLIDYSIMESLDMGPLTVSEREIRIEGLKAFDEVFFKVGPGHETQGFSTREIYPTWKQDLWFLLGNTSEPSDAVRSLVVGPDIQRVEVYGVDPVGLQIWHRDFRLQGAVQTPSESLWRREGLCPRCGASGNFVGMALCCPRHGAYAGI